MMSSGLQRSRKPKALALGSSLAAIGYSGGDALDVQRNDFTKLELGEGLLH